jgi:hypothetical protein
MLRRAFYWEKTYNVKATNTILHNIYYQLRNKSNYLSIYSSMSGLFIYPGLQLTPRMTADIQNPIFPHLLNASPSFHGTPKFITLFVRAHYLPYPQPAEPCPHKTTVFPSDSFYKRFVCTSDHFLSGIRNKIIEYISFQVFLPKPLDIFHFTRKFATCTAHFILLIAAQYHLVYPSV